MCKKYMPSGDTPEKDIMSNENMSKEDSIPVIQHIAAFVISEYSRLSEYPDISPYKILSRAIKSNPNLFVRNLVYISRIKRIDLEAIKMIEQCIKDNLSKFKSR